MTRALRTRATSALTVAAVTVSDLTAPAVFGLEARPFREFLVREKVRHARLGHRVVARVEDILAALDRVAQRASDEDNGTTTAPEDDGPADVDSVLRVLGKVRA